VGVGRSVRGKGIEVGRRALPLHSLIERCLVRFVKSLFWERRARGGVEKLLVGSHGRQIGEEDPHEGGGQECEQSND
jgi:hypothetical protein